MGSNGIRSFALLVFCFAIAYGASDSQPNQQLYAASRCPEDSVENEHGDCKCAPICPPTPKCSSPDQHPILRTPADPGRPGSCCPRYECVPSGQHAPKACPVDSVPTEDGHCKCVPSCPPFTCGDGEWPVAVRKAVHGKPGACCPLYVCKAADLIRWTDTEDSNASADCFKNGVSRRLGDKWQEGPCINCVCKEKRQISCQAIMCKACENPIPPDPGECCPHCPQPTNTTIGVDDLDEPCETSPSNCTLQCEHGYETNENNCPICKCAQGTTENGVSPYVPLLPEEDKICPELPHCEPNCELIRDERGCSVCACRSPDHKQKQQQHPRLPLNVTDPSNDGDDTDKKICPKLKCELHCERGLLMDENDCTLCECKPPQPHDDCPPLVGCKRNCKYGYRTNKRGCPICRCRMNCVNHQNQLMLEGSTWLENACTNCTCELGGRITCKETVCSVACSDPLPPEPHMCCPVCPVPKDNETGHQNGSSGSNSSSSSGSSSSRGWGVVPITLIVVLAMLCLLLIVHIVRSRFRGRLSPSDITYPYPPQYYKCVPAYDPPVHRSEKIVPL